MAGLQNVRLSGQKQGGVGVQEDHRLVVGVVFIFVARFVVQFTNDPSDGFLALSQMLGRSDQPVGVALSAVNLHGFDYQGHDGRIGGKRFAEVARRPIPNLNVGMQDGFLDLVFGVSHGCLSFHQGVFIFWRLLWQLLVLVGVLRRAFS